MSDLLFWLDILVWGFRGVMFARLLMQLLFVRGVLDSSLLAFIYCIRINVWPVVLCRLIPLASFVPSAKALVIIALRPNAINVYLDILYT